MLSVIEKIETLIGVMRIGSAERGKMHISISNKKGQCGSPGDDIKTKT